MKTKYVNIIKNEILLLINKKLKKAVKIAAKLAIKNFIYKINEKKFYFIKNRINNLDKIYNSIIFIKIIKIYINKEYKENKPLEEEEDIDEKENKIVEEDYKDIDFKEMKEYIFEVISNNWIMSELLII